MVTVVDLKPMENDRGQTFFGLVIQGGIEVAKSAQGRAYLTARRTTISTTFDEDTCLSLVGTKLPGRVEKVPCDAYDYTVAESGELIRLTHRYEYVADEMATVASQVVNEEVVI